MKYVTFNIRCDYGQDGINNFEFRKPLILQAFEDEKPDIVGFQEVLPHVAVWLRETMTDYTVIGCGRGEKLDGEQMTLAYRKDAFNLMEFRTFWLSPTPYAPGSRYEDQSDCPRTVTDALLEEKETHKVFRVLNTHLDHVGSGARTLALEQILLHLDNEPFFPEAPVILAGDFNAPPSSPEMQLLEKDEKWQNAASGVGITFHGYGNYPAAVIDYIYLRGGITCRGCRKWDQEKAGVFLSDHYPVCAELTLV